MRRRICAVALTVATVGVGAGCVLVDPNEEGADAETSADGGFECGAPTGTVERVIDGDTVELTDGRRIRYLLVDTPEVSESPPQCYGPEAEEFNRQLVEGQDITLEYDVECQDNFGRSLAYVSIGGQVVNELLVDRGYACVLHIPPNGADRVDEYNLLQAGAEAQMKGMWGACGSPCG